MIDSPWNLAAPKIAGLDALKAGGNRKQLEQAAAGFESVLLREWLRQVRTSTFTDSPGTGAGYLEMADDQLAALVSRGGGLGLARQLADQLLGQVKGAALIAADQKSVNRVEAREVSGG